MRDSSWTHRVRRKKIASGPLFFCSDLCFSTFFFVFSTLFEEPEENWSSGLISLIFPAKQTHVLPASGPNLENLSVLTLTDFEQIECVVQPNARFRARARFCRFVPTFAHQLTPALFGLHLFLSLLCCSARVLLVLLCVLLCLYSILVSNV